MSKIIGYKRDGQNFTPIYEQKLTHMEFKVINTEARVFGDAVMSTERQEELSLNLDKMVADYPKGVEIKVHDVMINIAGFCNTIEEMTFCVILHLGWLAREKGIIL